MVIDWGHIVGQLWAERWDVLLLLTMLIYRKDLVAAFKGGNGVWQVDEIGKALMLFVFYASFRVESSRVNMEHRVFSDAYWFATLGSVALISGIKEGKRLLNGYNSKKSKVEGQADQSGGA